MAEPDFQQTQRAFAAYIRDPGQNPLPPGVKPERMAMYRELFFNNIKNVIVTGFPVLKEILDEAHWLELAQDFFARHRSQTPYFADIHQEFLAFLSQERGPRPDDPPFLLELAHYEWVELAISLAEGDAPAASLELEKAPLACVVALSDVAWPLAYRFPVQRIGKAFQPAEPPAEPTFLVVYRDREDAVRFLEINHATYRLLQMLEEGGPRQAEDCLRQIAAELGQSDPADVLEHGAGTIQGLAMRGVLGMAP